METAVVVAIFAGVFVIVLAAGRGKHKGHRRRSSSDYDSSDSSDSWDSGSDGGSDSGCGGGGD